MEAKIKKRGGDNGRRKPIVDEFNKASKGLKLPKKARKIKIKK